MLRSLIVTTNVSQENRENVNEGSEFEAGTLQSHPLSLIPVTDKFNLEALAVLTYLRL